jgi:hypothetical protein
MVALARNGDDSIALLGDPWEAAGALTGKASLAGASLEIRAVIEAVEALHTLRTDYRSKDEAKTGLRRDIAALTLLLEHDGLLAEQRKMLQHHYAKMLVQLDQEETAEKLFRSLLENDSKFAAARLQLARLLKGDEAVVECDAILAQHETDPETVSLNVLLETFRVLALNDVDMTRYEARIMASIEHAGELDLAVAIGVVSQIAQRIHFKSPDLVLRMFSAIEWSAVAAAPSDRFDWAQAHKFAAKAARAKAQSPKQFLDAAVEAYRQAPRSKPYHRTQFADALIELNRYTEANEELELVPAAKRDVFFWQRKAQALHGMGEPSLALAAINSALDSLTAKDERYRSTFLADRSRIRLALGDADALSDLETAIALLSPGDKNRERLEAVLDEARRNNR